MLNRDVRIPSGPTEAYKPAEDLLQWLGRNFDTFGDIYKASIYGTAAYVIRDPEIVYHVLVENWQNYEKGLMIQRVAMLLGHGLMVSEGEVWKRQRRTIQPTFNHGNVDTLVGLMATVNAELSKKWQEAAQKNEPVNVTRDVSGMALEVVLRFLFGIDYERIRTDFDLISHEPARNVAFARSFRALGKVILGMVERRREGSSPSADALSLLVQARDPRTGDTIGDSQLVDEIFTLIIAGHETTASTLNWTWYLLSQHPEIEARMVAEIDQQTFCGVEDLPKFPYTRRVLDEAMRLYPAGWLLTRKALADDWLGDYFLPAGTEVYVPPYFIHRNPNLWVNPEQFAPERFEEENVKSRHRLAAIPFSSGPRNCIGALFARTEMQIHLILVAKCLRLRFTPPRPIELDPGVNLRSKYDFEMFPEIRGSFQPSRATTTGETR